MYSRMIDPLYLSYFLLREATQIHLADAPVAPLLLLLVDAGQPLGGVRGAKRQGRLPAPCKSHSPEECSTRTARVEQQQLKRCARLVRGGSPRTVSAYVLLLRCQGGSMTMVW
jgi:hypothetical protein